MPPSSSAVPELLTVEEFAVRFRVGRSTVFTWIATNKMVQGIHYYKVGKTIRIPWSVELLAALSAVSAVTETPPVKYGGKNRHVINLDY
jgi:excisionase family DNA binding protein